MLDQLDEVINDLGIKKPTKEYSVEELEMNKVNIFNKGYKKSDFGECDKCGNKGLIAYLDENKRFAIRRCTCSKSRQSYEKLSKLGLGEFLKHVKKIDDLPEKETWQQVIKQRLKEYLTDTTFKTWLFQGGQVGSGKSTNCVLVLNEILKADNTKIIEWVNWETEYPNIAFGKNPDRLQEILDADVLVIDDFLRHQDSKLTETERTTAKLIINDRWMFKKLTLISSELTINEIIDLDEAIGSRILERCNRKFAINIGRDSKRNYRLNGTSDI